LAKEIKVCDVALGRRFKGHGPRHGRSGTNNKLNIYQESALCSLIRVEDAFMATPTVQEVQRAANGVICHCSERPRAPLHKIWVYGFFKRDSRASRKQEQKAPRVPSQVEQATFAQKLEDDIAKVGEQMAHILRTRKIPAEGLRFSRFKTNPPPC
jgi:hypothetical protein